MVNELFDWLLEIPKTLSEFTSWLTSPLAEGYINVSPLFLLGAGGVTIIIGIIVVHIVKLFL